MPELGIEARTPLAPPLFVWEKYNAHGCERPEVRAIGGRLGSSRYHRSHSMRLVGREVREGRADPHEGLGVARTEISGSIPVDAANGGRT
jgi:hypothetical protein